MGAIALRTSETPFGSKMKYVAAYLLANLGGKSGSKSDIEGILKSVGAEVNDASLTAFLKAVEGKSAKELIEAGHKKLASVPSGAAAPAPAAAAAPAAGKAAAPAKAPEPEPEEEEEAGMDFDLFD
eukprot:c52119_g1_i1.p1 GENE.c52119_g1_i1~~c52119_g1_i1.p1  ORF type:complete len:126 (-),score=38.73 c52119_g1_i1:94-471(-)